MGWGKQLAEYSTHLENMAFLNTRINESLNVKLIFKRGYDTRDNNITQISVSQACITIIIVIIIIINIIIWLYHSGYHCCR